MTRQEALQVLWKKLFAAFLFGLVLCFFIYKYGEIYRTSLFIFISGNVGSYVAIHRSLNDLTDVELTELSRSWWGIVVPSFVGGILAIVLYMVFLSGILEGDLFPSFEPNPSPSTGLESVFEQHAETMSDYAKIFFWSFVAGFNQKYVVDIIESVRSKT